METFKNELGGFKVGQGVVSFRSPRKCLALQILFYGYDGGFSVRVLTDTNGTVSDTWIYDAFGNIIERTGSTSNSFLYRVEEWDSEIGLQYLRARWYDPKRGRFISADKYEGCPNVPISANKFLNAHGDPVGGLDPSGYSNVMTFGAIAAYSVPYTALIKGVEVAAAMCLMSYASTGLGVAAASMSFELESAWVGPCYIGATYRLRNPPSIIQPRPKYPPTGDPGLCTPKQHDNRKWQVNCICKQQGLSCEAGDSCGVIGVKLGALGACLAARTSLRACFPTLDVGHVQAINQTITRMKECTVKAAAIGCLSVAF